jgi:mRNA-degrading endonuclease RelE of RelBE toxin-antitoxin system
MAWTVMLSNKAAKQYKKLPKPVRDNIDTLVTEIRVAGPVRGNWPNYSKLSETEHHCHIKKANQLTWPSGVRIKDRSDLWR